MVVGDHTRYPRFRRPDALRGWVGVGGPAAVCATLGPVPAMSALPLSDRLALVAADPVLAGHPVVAGLVAVVGELVARQGALEAENAELREENADLRRQLGRHSGNSGQPGNAGRTRRRSERVDVHEDHWPVRCDAGAPACRQVHDLPAPPPLVVTEHRAQAVRCPGCRTRTRAAFSCGWTPTHPGPNPSRPNPTPVSNHRSPDPQATWTGGPEQLREINALGISLT